MQKSCGHPMWPPHRDFMVFGQPIIWPKRLVCACCAAFYLCLPSEAKRMRGAIKTLIWYAITMNEGCVTMTSFIGPQDTRSLHENSQGSNLVPLHSLPGTSFKIAELALSLHRACHISKDISPFGRRVASS